MSKVEGVYGGLVGYASPKMDNRIQGSRVDPVDHKTGVIACLFTPGLREPERSCGPQNLLARQEHISLGCGILRSTQKSTDTILCGVDVGHFEKLMFAPATMLQELHAPATSSMR